MLMGLQNKGYYAPLALITAAANVNQAAEEWVDIKLQYSLANRADLYVQPLHEGS